jgi:hypothetical protein
MNEKVNSNILFRCITCNKNYSSKSSLCNHNKKFHSKPIVSQSKSFVSQSKPKVSNNYKCLYCENEYKHKQSKWKHEQKCKIKHDEILKLKETTKQKELELEYKKEEIILRKEEAKILQLKLKLQKSEKVDNITLKKLNKMLLERHNRIQNSTVNSNNTINIQNNIVNNYKLIGFGKEDDLNEVLTNKDKKMILDAKYGSLEKLIEIVHCGKYHQFKNIIITNMKDNYMYKYDEKKGVFVLSTKSDVINSLIDYRICDLEVIYNELLQKNKVDDETKNCIEKFINKINYSDSKYMDFDGKEHENYKQYKISEIKILLFNNQDKITNDISLFLSTIET